MESITNCGKPLEGEITVVSAPIKTHVLTFLMFAEYMGYVSAFIEDIDGWIDGGKVPEKYIQAFLLVEAQDILANMLKEYTNTDLRQWWSEFYPLVLYKADDVLNKAKKVEHAIIL